MTIRYSRSSILLVIAIFLSCGSVFAQSTAFTYQGELKENGNSANGSYNLEFRLFDALSAGNQIGTPVSKPNHPVADGIFTVELDFGADAFNNSDRWLEVNVNGFTLDPRTRITRSPYSIQTRGIFVNENNRVGIGTTDPQAELHLSGEDTGVNFPRLRIGSSTGSFTVLSDLESSTTSLEKHRVSGAANIELNPMHSSGIGDASVHFFRRTDTTGDVNVKFFRGNGFFDISSQLSVDGSDSYFHRYGGHLGIGTVDPEAALDVVGDSMFRNRLGIGQPASAFGQLSIADSGDGSSFALDASWNNDAFPTLFASNAGSGGVLWANGDSDAALAGGGVIVVGDQAGENVAVDGNEIMARNNGSTATLHLNAEGGQINMGQHDIHPAFAYGSIELDGTVRAASTNLLTVGHPEPGVYILGFDAPLDSAQDVILVSVVGNSFSNNTASYIFDKGELRVLTYDDGSLDDVPFSFVIYRP